MHKENEIDEYGRKYPNTKYHKPQLTCDALVFKIIDDDKKILLITRGKAPDVGKLAFPGGHLDYNEEPQQCCLRELKEETGLIGTSIELIDVRGHPLRDSRGHYVTVVYKVTVQNDAQTIAGDDAASADWYSVNEVIQKDKNEFAFDHYEIFQDYIKKTK